MDKIILIFGSPGLAYLNTVERKMSVLSMVFENLALSIDPDYDEWLLNELLSGTSSMKVVRAAVHNYDIEIPKAMGVS